MLTLTLAVLSCRYYLYPAKLPHLAFNLGFQSQSGTSNSHTAAANDAEAARATAPHVDPRAAFAAVDLGPFGGVLTPEDVAMRTRVATPQPAAQSKQQSLQRRPHSAGAGLSDVNADAAAEDEAADGAANQATEGADSEANVAARSTIDIVGNFYKDVRALLT
jgi:hypothetical protein